MRRSRPASRMLDEWAESKKITQRDATNLRNDLLDMIDAAMDWDAELLSVPRDLTPRAGKSRPTDDEGDGEEVIESGPAIGAKYPRAPLRSAVGAREVYLPFNPDKTGAAPDEAIFTLCREEVVADPVAFAGVRFELRALVRFHAHRSFDYSGGDEDRAWYARLADRATAQAVRFLRDRYERVPDNAAAVTAVAQTLYVSARVLDLPGAHSNVDSEVLKAVLHPGAGRARAGMLPETGGTGSVPRAPANRATARDFVLRRLSARQGTGNVLYGIDANELLEAIKPVRKSCRVEVKFPGDPKRFDANALQVHAFVSEVAAERTEAAVADRRAALVKWATDTRAWLGEDFKKDVFVADCRGLLNQASNLQVYTADVAIGTLRDYLKDFDDAKVSEAIAAVDRLKDVATPSVVLTAVVQAPDDAMRKADTFRTAFQAFEQQTLSRACAELTKKLKLAKAAEDADPDSLLPAEATRLDADLRTLMTAAGGTSEAPTRARRILGRRRPLFP